MGRRKGKLITENEMRGEKKLQQRDERRKEFHRSCQEVHSDLRHEKRERERERDEGSHRLTQQHKGIIILNSIMSIRVIAIGMRWDKESTKRKRAEVKKKK